MTIATGEQALASDVNAINSSDVTLLPGDYDSVGQGTWTIVGAAAQVVGQIYSGGADGDNVTWKAYLGVGTYTLKVVASKNTSYGVIDIYIDAAEVASFDLYNGSAADNTIFTQASISVAAAGVKSIKVQVDGKNASSSSYIALIQYIRLYRTA